MASSLKISYAQIPFNSVSITPSVAADTNNNEWNLVAGPRYQRFFYGSSATSSSTVYDIGTTYASKDSTVDHLLVARADFLQDDGTTDIILASSPDNATWTDRITISSFGSATLVGPRANDYVATTTETAQIRYWRVTYSGSSQVYRHSKCYFGKFFTFDYDPSYEIDFIPAKDSYWYASSGAAHFVRPGDPIYRITLTATAMSDTNVKSFEDNIARYAHRTPVFLYDVAVPQVLNNVSPIHAWLVDYSVEKVAYNYNQINAVYEEAIG